MNEPSKTSRRAELKRGLREDLERSIEGRVERYLEVVHQGIIPNHHFAAASSECIDLYRDGYFLSAVMVSQAVTEGIWRFVLERKKTPAGVYSPALAALLVERKVLTADCALAFGRIWRSFRNDVHHMNPSVEVVPFRELARRNLMDVAVIEREIFAVTFDSGEIVPVQPCYWDVQSDGTTSVFLRNS